MLNLQNMTKSDLREAGVGFSEDDPESKKGFTFKIGEDVLKRKEEIENIYKEEDKKKEKLKQEFTGFMDRLDRKIRDMRAEIQQERHSSQIDAFEEFKSEGAPAKPERSPNSLELPSSVQSQVLTRRQQPEELPSRLTLKRWVASKQKSQNGPLCSARRVGQLFRLADQETLPSSPAFPRKLGVRGR